jgi:hypothetical protein
VTAKPCRICGHREYGFIDMLLSQGVSPRNLARRVGGVTRRSIQNHQRTCLQEKPDEKEEGCER